ncbi:MAG: hypothetical protein IPJ79_20055 [Bacteroidetes bacterium]|nr:hypothetical protein [Bacteroidota bacterium]
MKKVIYTIVVMCLLMAHKSLAQTILLNEDFSVGVLPPGWSIDSAGVTPLKGWQFTGTPWVQPGNGFDSNYYYPRIESTSSLINLDCNLTTPFFNTTGINKVFLSYSELASFNNSNSYNYSMQKVELTTDSGFTWQELFTLENYRHPSKRGVFDITNEALGFPYVKVRFRYISRATVIGEWAIDSVVIADSIPCLSPPDTGIAVSDVGFACAGEQVKLKLDDLSRGIGQTYQWQHKSSNTGNVFVNIPGAVYDTVTHTQPVATYYQCLVTCGGLTDNSTVKFVSDTPNVGRFNSANYCLLCPTCTDTILLLPSYTGTIPNPIGGPGVVFQWQKTDSLFGVYSDIPGATNNYYVASLANHTTGTYFQCKQTCAATGYTRSISQWTWFYEMINPTLCAIVTRPPAVDVALMDTT